MLERQPGLAAGIKEPHQCAVGGFPERIEIGGAARGVNRRLECCGFLMMRRQRLQHGESQFAKPLALAAEPFLERHLGELEPVEQVAAIERVGSQQIGNFARLRKALELVSVNFDMFARQGHRFAPADECHGRIRRAFPQSFAQRRQRLA